MAEYYCTDSQITNILPSTLTGSEISSAALRNTILRTPAKAWVDSLYPVESPFPPIGTGDATGWLVNQSGHAQGAFSVTVDGGTVAPAAGDIFTLQGHNAWYKITSYSSNVINFREVDNFNAGVETDTASGARAAFLDDTPIYIGTPMLVQTAAMYYAAHLAYIIMRNNPQDEMAAAALEVARNTLQVGEDDLAHARPYPWFEDARDNVAAERISPAYVELLR